MKKSIALSRFGGGIACAMLMTLMSGSIHAQDDEGSDDDDGCTGGYGCQNQPKYNPETGDYYYPDDSGDAGSPDDSGSTQGSGSSSGSDYSGWQGQSGPGHGPGHDFCSTCHTAKSSPASPLASESVLRGDSLRHAINDPGEFWRRHDATKRRFAKPQAFSTLKPTANLPADYRALIEFKQTGKTRTPAPRATQPKER